MRHSLDSFIDIIVGRPVIREHHLIQKIPHYFDETTSSRPDLSQSVTPVTPSLVKLSRVCAQPCTTCTPFMLQGYDNTLCSLTMKRPDRPLVSPERRRRLLQTSHRLTSLLSSREANYWMPSRTTQGPSDTILQQSSHWRSIELVNQGKRVLWNLLWLQDFRGLTR